MGCGCGGGAPRIPMTSGDYAAVYEAQQAAAVPRFRLVRDGHDDEPFATWAAARQAQAVVGGKIRTIKAPATA